MEKAILCLGIDENGLGPRLGPLVVTAVTARVAPESRALVRRRPRGALAKRLARIARHRQNAGDAAGAAEALTRAIALAPTSVRYRWRLLTLPRTAPRAARIL